ncbi:TetR/AcrR family transcriptional regulator [Pantoea ananatis]|uniref:TetR/AcrR family transcriptional regulator n=1 Tax=Pantoea ananas TaxID=553 RepID=UPI00158A9534|nr:TetR/AcrR family transcriptional regulator [Pantoea ananatis]MBA4819973.1 TetR/AcrR family transcriptional regulator [Pantoea ananatis]MCW1830983.1 TetR/AcrR family transcriptional regulator [Pantoea ananatis]QKV86807.1 TetR/AcrR family transcriptional regulator [Pantoea ananatis]
MSPFTLVVMNSQLSTACKHRERGRPREFNMEQALDKAMIVFRQKGYHAASLADLGEAMNLSVGSIYKAFQDKRSLFLLVFQRYIAVRNADLRERLAQYDTGRAKLSELLQFYLDSSRGGEGRTGCLVVGSAIELQVLDAELSQLVAQVINRNKHFLMSLLEEGQHDGSISADLDIETAAGLILRIAFGMRVTGKVADVANEQATIALALKILD